MARQLRPDNGVRSQCVGRHPGSKLVGRSELFVVTIELAILVVFAVFGVMKADPGRFAENGDHHWFGVLFAAGLLYVTYEGFGVVTNVSLKVVALMTSPRHWSQPAVGGLDRRVLPIWVYAIFAMRFISSRQ